MSGGEPSHKPDQQVQNGIPLVPQTRSRGYLHQAYYTHTRRHSYATTWCMGDIRRKEASGRAQNSIVLGQTQPQHTPSTQPSLTSCETSFRNTPSSSASSLHACIPGDTWLPRPTQRIAHAARLGTPSRHTPPYAWQGCPMRVPLGSAREPRRLIKLWPHSSRRVTLFALCTSAPLTTRNWHTSSVP